MADNRIRIAKDKAALVKALTAADGTTGPFQTYVEVMVFAAALGAKRNKRVPLGQIAKDLSPLRQEYFVSKFDAVINLLAITETQDINILAADEIADDKRIRIFEEYANGGLEALQKELRGAVDYTERLLLILSVERFQPEQQVGEFDLSRFLS